MGDCIKAVAILFILMKKIVFCLFFSMTAHAALKSSEADRLANAIYVIEGGSNTRYPYGIKSINTKGNKVKARKICIRTIQNTHDRWLAANKPIDFLDYLANRYCPPSADRVGNYRWKVNIRKFVNGKH